MKPGTQTLLLIMGLSCILVIAAIPLIISGFVIPALAFLVLFAALFMMLILARRKEKPKPKPAEQGPPDTIYELQPTSSLPNGMFFNEILSKTISHAQRRKQLLAILIINIDNFKKTQAILGDQTAELLLTEVGKRIMNVLRNEDVLAKLEGDTFIILLEDISKTKFAGLVAEKILQAFHDTFNMANQAISLTPSIGISIYPHDSTALENLIEKANTALYKAIHDGGNQYQYASEKMHVEALEYIHLDSALRKAIHNNELALYYQPLYRIKTGSISGVEALMRWEHPVLGLVDPTTFTAMAEESGLILQMGEWALRQAAQQILFWQKEGYTQLSIALKISPKQFHDPNLAKIINSVLAEVAIDPGFIELEITERTLMEDVKTSQAILQKLKDTGVHISIDHFGTGYTSIQYLKQFPLSSIKIDRSYIKGLPNYPDDIAITNAIIALAHQLGLEVVAEGVETADQIQHLLQQGCDIVQGYYLGHPLTADKMTLQLRKLQEEVLI